MNDTILHIIRWTDRPVTKQFVTMAYAHRKWDCSPIDLVVSVHGKSSIDPVTASYPYLRNYSNPGVIRYPQVLKKLFEDAIFSDTPYDYVGLLDDDAYIHDPVLLYDRMKYCFAQGRVGQTGPHNEYTSFIMHNNERDPWFHWQSETILTSSTPGCQFYSAEALRETHEMWSHYYSKAHYSVDSPLHVFLAMAGFRNNMFYIPKFGHLRSHGSGVQGYSEEWYRKAVADIRHDCGIMLEVIALSPEKWPTYAPGIYRFFTGQVVARGKRALKHSLCYWPNTPVATKSDEVLTTLYALGLKGL